MKRTLLGTLIYAVVTFPLAVVWHVVLFQDLYERLGYFEGEPSFVLGLLSILVQGAVMAWLFPRVKISGSGVSRGLRLGLLFGLFHWTVHVLAFVAKQNLADEALFVGIETAYLTIQFGVFGILMGLLDRRAAAS